MSERKLPLILTMCHIETTKVIEYIREKGLVFLLNKEKPSETLRLVTVKLKLEHLGDSESDDLDIGNKGKHVSLVSPRFDFVREV
jgi:hypothetical protein